jgi:hypothetical protein
MTPDSRPADQRERARVAVLDNLAAAAWAATAVPGADVPPCESALGPNAYLAALFQYATGNLLDNGDPVTPQWLEDSFCQPFGSLELSCAASDDQVNQTRVVIEVLRTYLKYADPDAGYVRDSYSSLLLGIGTSDAELRLVRHGDDASRTALAARLGIDVTHLNALLLLGADLTESSLFKIFGLLPTSTTAPLPAEPELLTWQLQRLEQSWTLADRPADAPPDWPPVVDPDLITAEFFVHPDSGNAAFDLWDARRTWVAGQLAALDNERKGQPSELAGFNAVTTTVLGTDGAGLNDLADKRAKGQDIGPRLAELGLLLDEFNYLVTLYRILAGGEALLDVEWSSVCSILTQVDKRGKFAGWRAEEAAAQVILAPAWFLVPDPDSTTFPPPPLPPLPAWRATVSARSAWESTLQARIDQAGQLRQALASVVAGTEVAALPGLRDQLLLRLPVNAGPDLAAKADWFARNFQVDTTVAGSQLTTRVGQAIETLQGVLWAVRTRQLTDTRPDLTLRSQVAFDDAWPWIGGFATWRAQQLVVLYPEDFMQTGLRRDQTPAFGKLVDATRDRPSLTPGQARSVGVNFAAAFEDTCRLSPGAACLAKTRTGPDGDPHGSFRDLYYTFAVSPLSGRSSWSWYDAQGPAGWADTAWAAIPGLPQVSSFIGAVPYDASPTRRWIVVAAIVPGPPGGRAVLARYDLENRRWDELPADLTLPGGAVPDSLALGQPVNGGATTDPPLLFAVANNKVLRAALKADASGIDAAGWQAFDTPAGLTQVAAVRAAFASTSFWQLVTEKQAGVLQIVTKGVSTVADVAGKFIGTVYFPPDTGYLVYRLNTVDWKLKYTLLDQPGTAIDFPVDLRGLAMVTGMPAGKPPVRASWLARSTPWRAELKISNSLLDVSSQTPLAPVITGPFTITDTFNEPELVARRAAIKAGYQANATAPCSVINQLDEAYCYAPVHLAGQLQAAGQYIAALDWLRTVFDDTVPWQQSSPFTGVFCATPTAIGQWLADPLDAFALAQTRGDPRLIFALKSTISCLLGYGDSEFSRDSPESVPRARALYLEAVRLVAILRAARDEGRFGARLPDGLAHDGGTSLGELLATAESWRQRIHDHLASVDGVAEALDAAVGFGAGLDEDERWFGPLAGLPGFVVPTDGVADALEQHAQVNLYKISNGCNVAGMVRQLDPYAVPRDAGTGLPVIGGGSQLWLPAANPQAPTPYRYGVVIERAKQLAALANQLETALLSALEKRDAEYYTLMRARQDLGLAQAGVQLADLRVREAQDNVTLAQLGQQRAESQVSYYGNLLEAGVSDLERDALILMGVSAGLEAAAGASNFLAAALPASISAGFPSGVSISTSPQSSAMAVAAGLSSLAAAANTTGSILSTVASYDRRKQEWEQQKNLAQQDTAISAAQVVSAQDNVRIVGQDRNIAALQAEFASTNVEYLANKFTNVALYEWMSQVLEGVYRSLLQQATSMAQVAAAQLAFERQETPPVVIKSDYWQMPPGGLSSGASGDTGVDRKGLTGSYRLLDDITRLDQYAFATVQRKLQLTKTISLARLSPAEFQRLRQSGVMEFATPSGLFDLDFPGQYLRLISRVRTSVVALVPATDAIKATLTTSGTSRVVVTSNDVFRPVVVKRVPEQVALTSPRDATGLFELSPVSTADMLLPFEGSGVDTNWRFELPKPSNLFDFSTLADVLLTIEYTALASDVYRVQVVRQLARATSADRPFSFRSQFPDQWYDLHNPSAPHGPFSVRFATGDANFPPNLSGLVMTELAMFFARKDASVGDVLVDDLKFTPKGGTTSYGGGASSIDGVISTRRGNAPAWIAITGRGPAGDWELTFPEAARPLFASGGITDVLFDITYRYQVAAWPDDPRR